MIMADPKRWLLSRFNRSSKRAIGRVEDEYFRAFKQNKRIHATCEDYRAAATIDLEHDKKDRNKKDKINSIFCCCLIFLFHPLLFTFSLQTFHS